MGVLQSLNFNFQVNGVCYSPFVFFITKQVLPCPKRAKPMNLYIYILLYIYIYINNNNMIIIIIIILIYIYTE